MFLSPTTSIRLTVKPARPIASPAAVIALAGISRATSTTAAISARNRPKAAAAQRLARASLTGSFFPPRSAPHPGVSGSPVWIGMSITLPRCTPNSGRYGPAGKTSPWKKPSSRGSE